MERLHQQLRESLSALVTSEDWQRALAVAARFHDYSFANTQLIWSQALARGFEPTRVAGYRTWQQLGRQVRGGEKGIQILAPVTRTVEADDGEEERKVVGFRVVHVFDQSQTDGLPLPEVRAAVLEGDLPLQWDKVAEMVAAAGFTLEVADVDRLRDANGITDWRNHQVVVRESLPGTQRFKTLVHELAHIRLHEPTSGGRPDCRGMVEVEAESVAYMVCAALGVDSAGYSLPYVASWSGGDLDKVAATADRVIRCARQVLDNLELEQDLARNSVSPQILISGRRREADRPVLGPTEEVFREEGHRDLEEALESAVAFYQEHLDGEEGDQARRFLRQRGLGDDIVARWRLGFAPAAWDTLVNHLRSQQVPDEILLEAGLAGRARTGHLYDRMRGRVIFPIFDAEGSPRGFAGRLLSGDGPKYLNSPETPLYKKSALLYGLHHAKDAIVQAGRAIVVEGYTDAIAANQAGLTNTVATGGTALTHQQVESLRPLASSLTLVFDGDKAGREAAVRVAELPESVTKGLTMRVARLPEASDPASLLASGRCDVVHEALDHSMPLPHHQIDQIVANYALDEPEAMVRAIHASRSVIAQLTSPADRDGAVSYLAERVGRSRELVELSLRPYLRSPGIRRMERRAGRSLT